MRGIKFEFLYKGLPYSAGNQTRPWFKKVYTINDLIDKSLKELSDVHEFSELIARRQYTGLKDAHGVEIYEGDIIECWGYYLAIVWDETDAAFFAEYETIYESGQEWANTCKVMGNIYQHTHLLNQEGGNYVPMVIR